MAQISINNLTFSYEGSYDNIFENVSFQIDTDWKLGLIGRNGRGKTTFLNLLMGKYEYRGSITAGSASFDYFPFEISDRSKSAMEVATEINPDLELWELIKEVSKLEVSDEALYRPFNSLSNGEQTKVMLAILFLKQDRFLLIDEPTNHLDTLGREIVSNYLNSKKGFILVSHDRNFLDGCVSHIMSINKKDIGIEKGNFTSWEYNKNLRDNFEIAENEKLKKDIKRLSASSKRTEGWSNEIEKSKIGEHAPDRGYIGHKAAKMMKRAKSIEGRVNKAIEDKEKLLKNIEKSESLKIIPLQHHSSNLIAVKDLSISYGDKKVCEKISFEVNAGDRISINGKNGSGKSSILKLIMGSSITYDGSIYKASNLVISYVPQDTSFLKGDLSSYAKECNICETIFKALLNKLDFSKVQYEKNMEDFSAGQKKKVLIARSLCEKAHIYIWDEPLNYIDIYSRIQIEDLISSSSPTLLFVEHDKAFNDNIATDTINL